MIKKKNLVVMDILLRYLVVFLLGLFNLYFFYWAFGWATTNVSAFFVSFFEDVLVVDGGFLAGNTFFSVVGACIGGSAYYLLLILVMGVRDVVPFVRFKMLVLSFLLLFFFNVSRIVFLVLVVDFVYFDLVHTSFWYLFSSVFVFLDWLLVSSFYQVKSIPLYSDFIFLISCVRDRSLHKKKGK